jgi:hypothetical protein
MALAILVLRCNELRGTRRHRIRFGEGRFGAVVFVHSVCGGITGFEGFGDAGAPDAAGVAGVDQEGAGGSRGEDVAGVVGYLEGFGGRADGCWGIRGHGFGGSI